MVNGCRDLERPSPIRLRFNRQGTELYITTFVGFENFAKEGLMLLPTANNRTDYSITRSEGLRRSPRDPLTALGLNAAAGLRLREIEISLLQWFAEPMVGAAGLNSATRRYCGGRGLVRLVRSQSRVC